MLSRSTVVPPAILLTAVLGSACGGSLSAPSSVPSPVGAPAPPSPPDLSHLVGVWNVAVRVTAVSGTGCVAEAMRSQIGVPNPYSLTIAQKGYNVVVTLKSASGDYACRFTPLADSSGFTTYGVPGYYTCEHRFLDFRCSDGALHSIFSIGEDISGRVWGTQISGAWDAVWFEMEDYVGVEMKAQFTGSR